MPFENDIGTENPVQKYISYAGSIGRFVYYDKEIGDNVELPHDRMFYVIDKVTAITGFHEDSQSSIYSNEVRNSKKEPFVVRAYNERNELVSGIYAEIKGELNSKGGKYSKVIYALYNGEIVKITLAGIAMSEFIDAKLSKKRAIQVGHDPVIRKKGSNNFYAPTYTAGVPKDNDTANRDEHKDKVDAYLKSKFESQGEEMQNMQEVEVQTAPVVNQYEDDDLPF